MMLVLCRYVVEGNRLLSNVEPGDIIESIKVSLILNHQWLLFFALPLSSFFQR
jgi:hypothetical protein